MTRGLHAQLSPHEEITLRRVATGDQSDSLSLRHLRRFEQLSLIERQRGSWVLTPLGHQRYGALEKPLLRPKDGQVFGEIDRILDKHIKEG